MATSASIHTPIGHCPPSYSIPCTKLSAPVISGVDILGIAGTEVYNYTVPSSGNTVNFCNVTVTLTHPGDNDTVYTTVLLPLSNWNGRYLATGGGGLAAGWGDMALGDPASQGWAVSSTEGGLTFDHTVDPQTGEWAIAPDGSFNEHLVINLAYRSIHDMVEVSKQLIDQFYGKKASYAYYSGCSGGGRQGYATLSKYPNDFDGVLATAPALYATDFVPADFWPAIVMRNAEILPSCIFNAFQAETLKTCDPLDGVEDGLISDHALLQSCPFDVNSLAGSTIPCPETNSTIIITPQHAEIVQSILEGPITPDGTKLWYGVAKGAPFSGVANTITLPDGTIFLLPFMSAEAWIKYLTFRDPTYDPSSMTHDEFFHAYNLSHTRMGPIYGNEAIHLRGFRDAGGKLLTWHGLADELIPPQGMLDFRAGVEEEFGGAEAVDAWYRLFLAPGVAHCGGGYGPNPIDPLDVLVEWVEEGNPPRTLSAAIVDSAGETVTRDLCRYPFKLVYQGGDVSRASSFTCA
ncbi:Tannase/feruloyl esterase [Aspergillus carlsbadensis]|nr:Tannase/feruloyl esterase [Aspergillus carlsbadensis]